MMLEAYFDESGKQTNPNADFICLAGYISDERWEGFCQEWHERLRKHDLPFLHLSKLMNKRPPYRDRTWTDNERDRVLADFIQPIRRHVLAGFGISVDARHYRRMTKGDRKLIGDKDALQFAFYRLIRLVIDQLNRWSNVQPISLNLDFERSFSEKCLQALFNLRENRSEVRKYIGSVGFADDEIYYPLQAADMLAFGTYRELRGEAPAYMDRLVELATQENPGPEYRSEKYDAAALDRLADDLRQRIRAP